MTEDLNREFQEVFQQLSISEKSVAPDIMLKLYAYYKQALLGNLSAANGESDVKNTFEFLFDKMQLDPIASKWKD